MNGFNDKALQAIWDGLGLPADIRKQEEFERLVYEWADNNERSVCCRDCKHYFNDPDDIYYAYQTPVCMYFADGDGFNAACVKPDGFCAWGEPKGE